MKYFDNCATTKIRDEVIELMYKSMKEDFGNPSSLHGLGVEAEKKVENARKIAALSLDVSPKEIFFTSGGTESNNIAIQGAVNKLGKRKKTILTTEIDHSSIFNSVKKQSENGYEVRYINVDNNGIIDIYDLESKLDDETLLVSISQVNSEIGSIQPIGEIGRLIKKRTRDAIYHVDGVQGFMKLPIDLKKCGIDLYSASSHKIHGPKGVGLIFMDKSLNLEPIIFGGGQEKGLRSGTENVNGIIGFGEAIRIMDEKRNVELPKVERLKALLQKRLTDEIENTLINSSISSSPYILNVSFQNVKGEVLLHYLEKDEIYVSTGSACNSKSKGKSRVLNSINIPRDYIEGTIRMCLSYETDDSDITVAVDSIKKYVNEIRKVVNK